MIEFEEAYRLADRIYGFLTSCGGTYENITAEAEWNILFALGSGQYVLKEENGEIVYFVSYWKVRQEDVDGVMERVKPLELKTGNVMYISEAGNKLGKKGMAEIIKRLREQAVGMQGLFWHRPAKDDQVFHFPSQKGAHHG